MKKLFLTLCCLFLSRAGGLLWGASPVDYHIRAELDVGRKILSGTETVILTNTTKAPLQELYFFLYPNRFLEKSPQLNEMNYRWYYPSGFDPGRLSVSKVEDVASGQILQAEPADQPGVPNGTVLRVSLPTALAPGTRRLLKIEFECKIPHKYGPFGHYRDTITLQGGWHPYLVPWSESGQPLFHALPEKSSFQGRIGLSAKRDAVVNGVFFDDVSAIDLPARQALLIGLAVSPQFYVHTATAGSRTVTFYSLSEDRYQLQKVMDSLVKGIDDAHSFFAPQGSNTIAVVETYLRAVMSFPAEDMILLSDRFFVTVGKFDFRNLNRLETARALGQLLILDQVAQRENPIDYNWVSEALAWAFRNEFLESHFKALSNLRETAGRMGMFRPFNRMAASPTIPFSETYVGTTTNRDPLRESLLYFNQDIPSGQLFAEKLVRTLGNETFQKIARGYLAQEKSFESYVAELSGGEMSWFFEQWKKGYSPDLDYRLSEVERNKKSSTSYQSRFTIEKITSRDLIDPVEIRVHREGKQFSDLLWDGKGSSKTFELETQEKVTRIEIDPRSQTVQTSDYNDLSPHSWEMVMDRGDVDVGSGGLGAGTRIRMHKVRDQGKWMFVTPFFSPAEYGGDAGMLFNFGGIVDGLVWNRKQEIALTYTFTDLRGGFANEESGRVDGVGQASGVKFRYTFQNKMFEEDPMDFEEFEFTTALYRKELGGDFNFFRSAVSAAKTLALHPKHKLAGIVSLGYSDGFRSKDEIPAQKLFDLAGNDFALLATSGDFLAENMLASSLEWRHDLMSDLDMAMPMNNRIRRLQGVLAFDTGWIAPRFDELFRLNQAIYGVRYGLRFHYDFLGIRPSNFTVDFGYRLGDGNHDGSSKFTFALGILQTI